MVSMQMEEHSPSPQPSPTPQCVGREFVRQYYTLLAEAPRYVHRFYSNESIFVHGSDTEEIIGQNAIASKIRDLSFHETRTRIRGLDAHETLGKGVVVQVVGEISVNNGPMRRFVQTFVLAPQSEKKYYVHNDIFRYEDELFEDNKLRQENGTPADPDAENTGVDQRPQPPISNGSTIHPDDVQNARFNLSNPQMAMPILPQTQPMNQQMPPQLAGSGLTTVPPTIGQGAMPQPQQSNIDGTSYPWDGGVNTGVHSAATTNAPPVVQQTLASTTMASYHPPPLPPRGQQQQQQQPAAQASMAPSQQPNITQLPPLPSTQAPADALSTASSASALDQQMPPRPQSVDKTSPVPSEEVEESADTGSGDNTWASRVKSKPSGRGIHQPALSQPPPHVTPAPGTSAPAMLSPTAGATTLPSGHGQQDFGNRPPGQQQQPYQQNRGQQQYRPARPNQYGPGGGSQDARSSPAPSGHQQKFEGGGGNRPQSLIDTLPDDQQVYLSKVPLYDEFENELKECFINMGLHVLDIKIIRQTRKQSATGQPQSCFGLAGFATPDMAQRLIGMKTFKCGEREIGADRKKSAAERSGGGGSGGNMNYQQNAPRHYAGQSMNSAMNRGGQNQRGGAFGGQQQRGGSVPNNRPMGNQGAPGGYNVGGGGGGNRQQGVRTFTSTGRGGVHQPQ